MLAVLARFHPRHLLLLCSFAAVAAPLAAVGTPAHRVLHTADVIVHPDADTLSLEVAAPYGFGATPVEAWIVDPPPARLAGVVRIEGTGGEPGVFRRQTGRFSSPSFGSHRIELRLRDDALPRYIGAPAVPSRDDLERPFPIAVRDAAVLRRGKLDPFLKTDGIYLKNHRGQGDIVRLRGVNLGGWLLQESFMSAIPHGWDEYRIRKTLTTRFGARRAEALIDTFQDSWITERDFERMADAGLNCVRLPIHWQNHMHEDGSFKRQRDGSIDFSRIDWVVRTAKRHGMYTLLDLHGAPGSQNGRDHAGDRRGPLLWDSPEYREMTKSLWRELARRYRDEPAVAGYDLMNEPARSNKAKQWDQTIIDFMSELYHEIRAVDPDHTIFISVWSEHRHVGNVHEGKTNIVLGYHWYIYKLFLAKEGTEADFWAQRVGDYARISRDRYNTPCFIGEFSFKDGPEIWTDRVEMLTRHGLDWAKWSYKTRAETNWGLYEARRTNDHNIPDFENDSYATIRKKWAAWRTEDAFKPDEAVIAALRHAAALHGDERVEF